jgi:hypothetical protein
MGLAAIDCPGQELELISQMRLSSVAFVCGVAGGASILFATLPRF